MPPRNSDSSRRMSHSRSVGEITRSCAGAPAGSWNSCGADRGHSPAAKFCLDSDSGRKKRLERPRPVDHVPKRAPLAWNLPSRPRAERLLGLIGKQHGSPSKAIRSFHRAFLRVAWKAGIVRRPAKACFQGACNIFGVVERNKCVPKAGRYEKGLRATSKKRLG